MMTYEAIPADQRDVAAAAIAAAFGPAARPRVDPVSGGASGALTYRLTLGGRAYFMRIDARRDSLRNPHHYACMAQAAAAGVAPSLHHADETAGVAIMDLLPQQPLDTYPGGPAALARGLGELVARLQEQTAFPRFVPYFDFVQYLLAGAQRAHAPGVMEPLMEGFARIRAAYPWRPEALVSSHNDPNPNNIIYDGRRLWLIDWETAYANDPLTDIAILANNLAPTAELEAGLLESWLGRPADAELKARLALMRQAVRLYYGGLILSLFPPAAPFANLDAPNRAQFAADAAEGRMAAGSREMVRTLGRMFLAEFEHGLGDPAFQRALADIA